MNDNKLTHRLNPQTRALIPLILIIFIDSMGYMLSIPTFLRLFTEHSHSMMGNISPAMANVLFSLCIATGSFGYMLGAPIIGTWSDSWGRKRTLVFSLLLSLIGFSLPIVGIYSSSLAWILVGRFIAGVASSSQSLAQTAVADISQGQQKAWYFAMVAIAMTLSLLIGPTIGAYLSDPKIVSWFNNTTPFFATLFLIFLTLILTLKLYTNTNSTHDAEKLLTLNNLRNTIKESLASSNTSQLFLIFFLYELGWSFYYQDISLYLTQKFDYSVILTSQFLAYTGIWMALGLTLGYKIITRYIPLDSLLTGSLVGCTFSFVACALATDPGTQWFFVIPGAIGVGMVYPTIMTLISDSVDKTKQGCILGLAAAAFSAPWGISALLIGPLTNIALSLPLTLAAGNIVAAMWLSYRRKRLPYLAPTTES
jgi:DHA1 family tetracycline resistance protein-like MFS transporter